MIAVVDSMNAFSASFDRKEIEMNISAALLVAEAIEQRSVPGLPFDMGIYDSRIKGWKPGRFRPNRLPVWLDGLAPSSVEKFLSILKSAIELRHFWVCPTMKG